MATTTYTVGISADTTQAREELSEVKKLLTELEKNKVKLKPEFDSKNIEKQVNQLGKYMEGRFGALDFSKVYSNLMKQAQSDPNVFAKSLGRAMHGFNLLDQAVKPEDISKLAAASAEEIFELVKGLGGLADTTKATGTPVTKRLQVLYDKYPNGIEGKGGSGRGNGFGASEETLNKISETLERIDGNVKNINDSIKTGAITVQAAADGAENVADKTKEAADAQAKLTEETKKTAKAEEQLGQVQEKNSKKKKDGSDKKTEEKKTEEKSPAQPPASPSAPSKKKDEKVTASKPKPIVPDVDTKPLEAAIKKEEDLKTATEGAVQALEKQKGETQSGSDTPVNHAIAKIDAQQTMLDAFLNSAKKAGAITQELGQKQGELAKAFQNTNAQIEEQNKTLNESQQTTQQSMFNAFANNAQKSGEALQQLGQQQGKLLSEAFQKNFTNTTKQSSARELSFKDITSYIGIPEDIKDFVFDADSAQSFLKKIEKSGVWSGQEKKIWAAFQSIRGFVGNEEIDDILDQFSDLEENFGYADQVFNSPDQGSKMERALEQYYDKYNRYKNLLEKGDIKELDLDTLRTFHQTNMKYKMEAMSPAETEQGYVQALDQMQKTLAVMEQYKKVLDQAMAEEKEISEYDQKFLLNYERNHEQIERIADRAQTGLGRFQEAKRQEAQKAAERKRENEEEAARREKEKQQREEEEKKYRKNFIEKDKNFDKEFNEENMPTDLASIDKQIATMEEHFGRTKAFKKDLENRMKTVDYGKQWLDEYKKTYNKRVALIQKLKDKKSELEAQQKEDDKNNKDSGQQTSNENVDQTQKDADAAQKNADAAQEAVDRAKKAADESEEAVRRANDAQKKLKQDTPKNAGKTSVTESANANQTAQNNVKNAEESKEVLESNLSQLQNQVNKLQDRKRKLEETKEQLIDTKKYDDKFFEIDAQESGKAVKKYRKDRTKEVTEELKRLEANLEEKQTELQKVQEKINNINETEQQIPDSQPQTESAKKKKSKKPKIIMPTKEQQQGAIDGQIQTQVENEKKNTDAAQQLGDQTQQTNDNLEKAKDLSDTKQQLLDSIFGGGSEEGGDKAGKGSGLQSESETISHLIDTLKDLPSATQALSEFDSVNANIGKNAQSAADAMQVEADAVSAMVQATQRTDGQNLEQPQTRSKSTIKPSAKPKATLAKESEEIKQVKEQIEQLQKAKEDAEQNLKSITLDDSTFDVGEKYQKRNAYTQVKQWADDLKKAQEEVNSLGKDADPQKAQEVLDNYDKMRIGFSKAYKIADNLNVGSSKNFAKPMEEFKELYQNLGEPSSDFKQVEERFTQVSTQAAERAKAQFEQQKQQAEVIMARLQARLEELQSKEKATPSTPEKPKITTESKPSKPVENKPDLGGNQTGNGVQTEGDKAADAAAKMKELADAKKQVTEANQNLAQSAQNTAGALNGESGAGANASKAFDPKPLQQEIDALKQVSEQQKKTIDEQKQAIDDLQKKQEEATNKKIENLQKENDAFTAQQQQDLQRYKEAELQTQMMLALQKQAAEEEAKVREEQEAKAAQKAKEQAEKAAQKAQTKADDKELAQAYGNYGKDFNAVLNAKSIQEFDTAVAHLTETERIFWDARLKNMGDSYAVNSNMYNQNDLPADYKKSAEAQTKGLKQRQMEIAAFTASLITEAEKQQAAFEKMDTAYKTNTQNPTKGHLDFITSTKVDDKQARSYMSAVDGVTESLQKLQSVAESMKNGTFDFGDTNALRELLELRQTLDSQMSTLKVEDKGYKSAQSELEAEANKTAEGLKKSLSGVADQIEGIQKKSKKLINPDQEYQGQLQASEQLLQVIKELIADINNNPLQFMDEGNVKGFRLLVDAMKEDVGDFQDRFDSQQGIQGRINTYFTSYKGAYTSFFREIKDSFKSQALGELQNEIDRTFQTFEDSITNLNRATGLNQGEFLNKYLTTNGGKATASQVEQQQKVRNAIAESYRGLITDISDELTKVQDRMGKVLGEGFLDQKYFDNFSEVFTAGLGDAGEFDKFQNNAQSAVQSLTKLKDIQEQMANGKLDLTQLAPDKLKEQIQEIVELFANLNEKYKDVTSAAKEFTFADEGEIERQRAGITQFLKSNQGISIQAKTNLQDYFNQLQQGISQADLTKLTDGWHQVADAEQAAGRTGATFMSELQTRFKSLSAYLLSFVSFYRIIGVFKDGINIIHELDDALTEMQKVSDESLSSLREYQKSTFDTANQIGTTAAQLQQSTADWMRLGEDLQTASQSAQTANVLFNVSEFDNINDATTALVAMSAAYADAEEGIDKMDIVDRLNLIGNNYAIATDELATALQDGAAALQTAGNDLDEAIALTTAGKIKLPEYVATHI